MQKMTFAELFKKKRAEKKLSFGDLEKKIGVTRGILFRYEKGHSYPSQKNIPKLCEVLGLDPEETFLLINKEKNPKSQITDVYISDPYLELRAAILKSYDSKIFSSQTPASINEIKKEFIKISPHPIETTLLYMTIRHLEEIKKIPSSTNYNMRDEAKNKRIEQAGLHWVYDKRLYLLTYAFEDKIKQLNHLTLMPENGVHPAYKLDQTK